MNYGDLTISVLAGLDVDAKGSGLTKEDRQQLVAKLQDKAHEIAALQPYAVGSRMLELLTGALRQSVAEALGEIWKQRKELREAASKGTSADIEKADVSLFDHSATWTLKQIGRAHV